MQHQNENQIPIAQVARYRRYWIQKPK